MDPASLRYAGASRIDRMISRREYVARFLFMISTQLTKNHKLAVSLPALWLSTI